MNFSQIYNGMVGRDFIASFNDNFTICNETFLSILAQLIYKVKSTDIKEFKVIEGVVNYTLEDEPAEGEEDTRTWTPVDITSWGNISGTLSDQVDLQNALDAKAAADTVATLSNIVANINQNLGTVEATVQTLNTTVSGNTGDIANIQAAIQNFVYSTTVKSIRINNSVFQWSPDGITWYEQPVINSIAWGRITGDIENQLDLKQKFSTLTTTINNVNDRVTALSNTVDSLSTTVTNLGTSFNTFKNETEDEIDALTNSVSSAVSTAEDAETKATTAKDLIDDHLVDYNNPHHITAGTVGLNNCDNTADMDKPLSTPQKTYVDNAIRSAIEGQTITGLVRSVEHINQIFVGTQSEYNAYSDDPAYLSMLSFVLDDDEITAYVVIESDSYTDLYLWDTNGNQLTPDDTQTTYTPYSATYYAVPYANTYFYGANVSGVDYKVETALDYTNQNTLEFNDITQAVNNGGNE